MPGRALLVDADNSFDIIGSALQSDDGLFYIPDDERFVQKFNIGVNDRAVKAMMAITREHAKNSQSSFTGESSYSESNAKDSAHLVESELSAAAASSNASSPPRNDEQDVRFKSCSPDPVKTWHMRFGHAVSVKEIRRLLSSGFLPPPVCDHTDCIVCSRSKYRRRFSGSLTNEVKLGKLHADTKGK